MWKNPSDETDRDGWLMAVSSRTDVHPQTDDTTPQTTEAHRLRCLCGKWWAYRREGKLILRCKLCRRDIVVSGDNLTITYR